MQSQHFVVMLFVLYLILGLGVGYIIQLLNDFAQEKHKYLVKIGASVVAMLLGVCFVSVGIANANIGLKMHDEKNVINPYFSKAIDMTAERAIEKRNQSVNEYYIFPDWGIIFGFDYLTGNNIPFSSGFVPSTICDLYSKGYSIVVSFWDEEKINEYYSEVVNSIGHDVDWHLEKVSDWGTDIIEMIIEPTKEND